MKAYKSCRVFCVWTVAVCLLRWDSGWWDGGLSQTRVGGLVFITWRDHSVADTHTLHFNLNSRCHSLAPNDTQHHAPDRLDEFFALCPHFKWFFFENPYCLAAYCSARHPDKCLITTSMWWLIKSIEFPALSLSDNRIVLAQCLWNQLGLFLILWYHA